MATWSLLPSSLVDHVAGFLTVQDEARMSAVCKSWQEAMTDGLCRRRPVPSIWIILHDGLLKRIQNGISDFASFTEGKRRSYFLSLPAKKVHKNRVQDESKCLQAFNPISRTSIPFPPEPYMWIKKAVFVPPRQGRQGAGKRPALDGELSFAWAGDNVWTAPSVPINIPLADIVVYEGKLYALRKDNQIVVFDLDGEDPSSSTMEMVDASSRALTPEQYSSMKRIGVISGELILVRWWNGWSSSPSLLSQFEVSVLQKDAESKWKWVTIKDLAGHAILYDFAGVIALPVEDHEELQADCIYFLDGFHGVVSLMVVNLKTKIESNIPHFINFISSRFPLWFLP